MKNLTFYGILATVVFAAIGLACQAPPAPNTAANNQNNSADHSGHDMSNMNGHDMSNMNGHDMKMEHGTTAPGAAEQPYYL